ncbi:Bifunctional ligase/repressor BirA [Flavimaricola marinus]|uniref:biotin--[biotin carboxyl-carrier protein] ligase n=2 Tax=Flavimaricola marinus TaxID=1819565 RepID=A0A238LFS7_9RHOB|nr:Bifunctional ligase/repressor BirA [Flavimaricola marinus]
MAEAARIVRTLDKPTWIMAHRQTEARGRRNRPWLQPKGNLAATLIFRPQATPQEAAKRSFLAANALFEALSIYVDRNRLALKWPNDVLLNGGKIAGILLESASRGPYVDWLSIGIGVNLTSAPTPPDAPDSATAFRPVSLIQEGGERIGPEQFLTTLADAFATQEAKLAAFGFPRIREDWLRNAARIGEEITARTGKETIKGIFDTIDQDGNLILITSRGPRSIAAADVFF